MKSLTSSRYSVSYSSRGPCQQRMLHPPPLSTFQFMHTGHEKRDLPQRSRRSFASSCHAAFSPSNSSTCASGSALCTSAFLLLSVAFPSPFFGMVPYEMGYLAGQAVKQLRFQRDVLALVVILARFSQVKRQSRGIASGPPEERRGEGSVQPGDEQI